MNNIQWFPGHMAKTKRMIAENMKAMDIVVEITDARVPSLGRNPFFDTVCAGKPRILVLNKADLADREITDEWARYYKTLGIRPVLCDSLNGKIYENIISAIKGELADLILRRKQKGMDGKAIRVMVVGVPNSGKSTFINKITGKKSAKTGDRPGITTGKQWITLPDGIELMDTPGLLWEKFENSEQGEKLAFSGAIKDDILDIEELAVCLLEFLRENYNKLLLARYKLESTDGLSGFEMLEAICKKRGFVVSGGEYDTLRGASILLDEVRGAKLGRISFEKPPKRKREAKMKNMMIDNLTVKILSNRTEMGSVSAGDIKEKIAELLLSKAEINMIFAAAPSQNDILACLASDKTIEWNRINAYHMDEYIGLDKDAPQGFGNFLRDHIFGVVPFKSVNYIDASAEDAETEAERYGKLLDENPTDIVIMGIGENGHIAFNDPPVADFNDKRIVKPVKLDEVCRRQQVNDGCFDSIDEVPQYALTLTIPTLVRAPYIFCIVPAKTKAAAVKETLIGSIDEHCPASILRRQKNAVLYLDDESSKLL